MHKKSHALFDKSFQLAIVCSDKNINERKKMITGIVLVNVERPKLKQVIQDILKLEGVTEVYTVAGEYDLVAMVRVADNHKLSHIIADEMPHSIDGITHTKTLIALNATSEFNLKEMFKIS
jgi:DNA-binding Lrp family transcriptional regulator